MLGDFEAEVKLAREWAESHYGSDFMSLPKQDMTPEVFVRQLATYAEHFKKQIVERGADDHD